MCGIFGLINGTKNRTPNASICKAVADGILLSSVRGSDSTGLMQRDSKATYLHRMMGSGAFFVKDGVSYRHIDDSDISIYTVAHNRAATEGSVTLDNAHPFEYMTDDQKNYAIGVHNGTLMGWKNPDHTFEVDSQWAISRLAERGDAAFDEFSGAWCFVWSDDRDPTVLKISRNAARPMYFAYVKNQDRMFFGSEHQMLSWITERNSVELEPEIYNIQPGKIYSFDLKNPRNFTKRDAPTKPVVNYRQQNEEKERTQYIAAVRTILFPTKKAETVVASAIGITTNLPAVIPAQRTPSRPPTFLTTEEIRTAKVAELFNNECSFESTMYDPHTQELWGSSNIGGILYTGVIRKVSEGEYEAIKNNDSMACTIIGCSTSNSSPKELILILSRVTNHMKPRSFDLEGNRAGEELVVTIAAEIQKFQTEKANDSDHPKLALL